ncbi:hypothetical protein [Portibacter marinus]|uniref:hypothetical protein n=1 Tax=Portibacter marinus TaxID=2898660 RepID=UPI001F19B5ED|nr:hypothetical protein [Portibacter marinus]
MIIRITLIVLLISCMKDKSKMLADQLDDQSQSVEVTKIEISGEEGKYTFTVELSSPDIGCDQYADWWEIINKDGDLIYRRNLGHSHVNEQPFSRSGGPVDVSENDFLYIRGHMNTTGYGAKVMSGTIKNGIKSDQLNKDFAESLANTEPLPPDCAF